MSFWKIDLTTYDGAENAARTGGYACFIAVALSCLGAGLIYAAVADGTAAMIALGGIAVEGLVFLIAGLRLRAGKGAFWGMAAAAMIAFELLTKLIGLSFVGIAIHSVLLIVMINGVRGALALRRNAFPEQLGEVFN